MYKIITDIGIEFIIDEIELEELLNAIVTNFFEKAGCKYEILEEVVNYVVDYLFKEIRLTGSTIYQNTRVEKCD